LDYQHVLDVRALPHGVVHGDLFRDNVLFDGDNLGGFIDFYYACDDVLLYDVAIAVNEWCLHHTGSDIGSIDEEKMQTFLSAYQAIRPFSQQEWKCWLAMLRCAALRFWLSRLHDFYFPQDGELTHTKDPNHFKKILQQYIDHADDLGEQAQE
jgi:homoserine kinase type II